MTSKLNIQADRRVLELLDFAASEGIELPMPIEAILKIEDDGGYVDLRTGEIVHDGASWLVEPTTVGEATLIVLRSEEEAT